MLSLTYYIKLKQVSTLIEFNYLQDFMFFIFTKHTFFIMRETDKLVNYAAVVISITTIEIWIVMNIYNNAMLD